MSRRFASAIAPSIRSLNPLSPTDLLRSFHASRRSDFIGSGGVAVGFGFSVDGLKYCSLPTATRLETLQNLVSSDEEIKYFDRFNQGLCGLIIDTLRDNYKGANIYYNFVDYRDGMESRLADNISFSKERFGFREDQPIFSMVSIEGIPFKKNEHDPECPVLGGHAIATCQIGDVVYILDNNAGIAPESIEIKGSYEYAISRVVEAYKESGAKTVEVIPFKTSHAKESCGFVTTEIISYLLDLFSREGEEGLEREIKSGICIDDREKLESLRSTDSEDVADILGKIKEDVFVLPIFSKEYQKYKSSTGLHNPESMPLLRKRALGPDIE